MWAARPGLDQQRSVLNAEGTGWRDQEGRQAGEGPHPEGRDRHPCAARKGAWRVDPLKRRAAVPKPSSVVRLLGEQHRGWAGGGGAPHRGNFGPFTNRI